MSCIFCVSSVVINVRLVVLILRGVRVVGVVRGVYVFRLEGGVL